MAKKSKAELLAEAGYPADYEEALARELEGYRRRQQELRAAGTREEEGAMRDAVSGEEAVLAELKRLGGKDEPAKRPQKAQQTRGGTK